jgi:hypothetical protein
MHEQLFFQFLLQFFYKDFANFQSTKFSVVAFFDNYFSPDAK